MIDNIRSKAALWLSTTITAGEATGSSSSFSWLLYVVLMSGCVNKVSNSLVFDQYRFIWCFTNSPSGCKAVTQDVCHMLITHPYLYPGSGERRRPEWDGVRWCCAVPFLLPVPPCGGRWGSLAWWHRWRNRNMMLQAWQPKPWGGSYHIPRSSSLPNELDASFSCLNDGIL